jgi:DNA repair protein RadC
VVVLLNAKHCPIGAHVVSIGSLTASVVHPRETYKCGRRCRGDLHCSQSSKWKSGAKSGGQIEITQRLRECGDLLGIRLVDHVIVAGDNLSASSHRAIGNTDDRKQLNRSAQPMEWNRTSV